MGVYYKATIIVGLPQCEIDSDILEKLRDEGQIEICPPYYDGSDEPFAVAGLYYLKSDDFSPIELDFDQVEIDKLKSEFLALTGMAGKVYLSPRGY
jgi:hypothetical protein